jgi:hypothetical protein
MTMTIQTDVDTQVGTLVLVEAYGRQLPCVVVATSPQILYAGVETAARLSAVIARPATDVVDSELLLDAHPASSMPAILEATTVAGRPGHVVSIDVPRRLATIQLDTGDVVVIDVG